MKKAVFESRKEFTAKDSIDLYDYFSDENHIIVSGLARGLPSWVPWFIARKHDSKTEEDYYVYNTTQEERDSFPALMNYEQIVLKFDDLRHLQKGFRCSVIIPEGIQVPNYEAFEAEWKTYLENKDLKKKKSKTPTDEAK